ncbi:hypothetical protein CIP101434_00270 [Corynebacterium diphtheriae]|nr:hypothetical protein CIP107502_00154 [Corynebacterium diphtheriae]CAB0490239.1 hypothetical protein CIP101434_00270 [Corynebacterium diphtheriae]CAB0530762.1 hypothetical protein CIP101280_02417 [Corynebacterium diphtheriae]CAB0922196.1 hypothetical protein FRC0430_02359 [Corynebacterium diphtheriae]CAB0975729.1 hypothetical protein FRC0436_02358 [Corynebacterium diphtheriae]
MRREYEVVTPYGQKLTLEMSDDYKNAHWPDAVLLEDTWPAASSFEAAETKRKTPTRNRAQKPEADK